MVPALSLPLDGYQTWGLEFLKTQVKLDNPQLSRF